MPLESASFIPDLDSANPAATDLLSQGDDHIRLIKAVLQATFPNFTGEAITLTEADINGLTSLISGGGVPTGTISLWYGSSGSVPSGWGICNGTLYPKADASGNIQSPDLRDKVAIGVGSVASVQGNSYGAATATATSSASGSHTHTMSGTGTHTHSALSVAGHALTISEMPAHSHTFTHGGPGSEVEGGEGGNTLTKTTSTVGGGAAHSHGISHTTADGGHSHTMDTAAAHTHSVTVATYQPAVALHYIMKL